MSNAATCTRVNLDKLVCDGRYQRPVEEKRVARIVNNFDSKLLGTRSTDVTKVLANA